MRTKIGTTIIRAFAIAVCLGQLTGCQSIRERRIHDRTDPNRASITQTSEGYDTLGRKWDAEEHKPGTPQPTAAPAVSKTSSYPVGLVKSAPSMVAVGDEFEYDLTVTAREDVADTTVVDTLPDGASYVGSEPTAAQDSNKLTWRLGNLNAGETKIIKVKLKADKEGELVNCATVSATPRACVTTTVGRPQLVIKKTGPEMAVVGQEVQYTVVVQNTGNTTAKNVVVIDTVPDGLSSPGGQQELTYTVGDLAPGASKSISIPLKADKRGKVCNKVVASFGTSSKVDAEACTTIVQAGIKVEKSAKESTLFINRAATYDIVVSNTGDTDLSGVVLTDTSASPTVIATAEGATVNGNTATWNVGELKAGDKKTFTVKVLSKVPGRYCDTASVTTTQGLTSSAQDCTEWKGITGVLLEFVDNPDPIQVGETSQYAIKVTNQGSSSDILDLNIVAVLPAELEVVPGTISDGGTVDGRTITWPAVSNVAPKSSVSRSYIAKGVAVGDARSKASITTSLRKQPIEQIESTTVY